MRRRAPALPARSGESPCLASTPGRRGLCEAATPVGKNGQNARTTAIWHAAIAPHAVRRARRCAPTTPYPKIANEVSVNNHLLLD